MNIQKVTIIIFLFALSKSIDAQEIEWENTIGGSSEDYVFSISQTLDKGYILGGFSISNISGDKLENSNGSEDYWVVKLDSLGSIEWQNTIGGNLSDHLYSISQTTDGGYLLGGYSKSFISGDKSENPQGLADYWVLKLDSGGSIEWQNTIGGNNNDYLYSIDQTLDGGYILGGISYSMISGDKTEDCIGNSDYWVIKINSSGNILWQNTIGGNGLEELSAISSTNDGGYIIAGDSYSNISGDKTENSLGARDYWVVKLDSLGNIQWQNTIGGNLNELLISVLETPNGDYLLSGTSNSEISGDKTENSQGTYDYWIMKLDSMGAIQWQNTIGGSDLDACRNICITNDGGFVVGGRTLSNISGDKSENSIGTDFWIMKLDSLGTIQWQNTVSGNGNDELICLNTTIDGGVILGGSSYSGIGIDKSENCQGLADYWVIKLSCSFNLIHGTAYADLNSDNINNIGEPEFINLKMSESYTSRIAFTNNNGFYSLLVLDTGNFQVVPNPTTNYFISSPLNHNAYFNSINEIDSLNDFAYQPTGTFDDLCITITPTGNFRSGFNTSYMLSYSNVGTTTISNAEVVFYPDSNVNYVSASIPPTSITTDSIVFSIGNLAPFQTGNILVTVNLDLGIPIGTVINSGAAIFPITGDVNPSCNISYWEVQTTGSFDPNDIRVSRSFLYDYEIQNQPELEYIIRFQNTGNDTAFTTKVLNPIDTTRLELSSIEIISSSHPMSVSWVPWERNMKFLFENILLPDSSVNEPMSHGFVRYKVKPKANLLVGDSINNQAHIYFDFNNPVATNIAKTDIILFTGTPDEQISSETFYLYPNPASTKLNVQFNQSAHKLHRLELYNIFGQKIRTIECANTLSATLDISDLANGIYFIKADQASVGVKRFVKN